MNSELIVSLTNKNCTPCLGDVESLSIEIAKKLLLELNNCWIIDKSGKLYKEYHFPNFIKAMDFANKVADLAETEGHHPDLAISWGKCVVQIWTHKISGLVENDFILAAKIDKL
ncbi:4a-hydroxytetrahydrobiopterin dehydratase domain protein (plasmid) [Candidatus Trichorickettsia mobilis]|uniref:4a-hydroxytetrahydrobiopterin dehydratase n=1 Tax=Candidatus Trichorickettsia mobilis TaxID=1346319 RepID=UPI002B25E23E|nr:4a-hydroxytetrahydrobiopterin dehydratase [Candidatus Trichorickettsia mobilis]WPY01905.1 4a-hydroxytetrahydrobiopterin dehydratase domain protein [Candidatus Trichorickettsia mobilis]